MQCNHGSRLVVGSCEFWCGHTAYASGDGWDWGLVWYHLISPTLDRVNWAAVPCGEIYPSGIWILNSLYFRFNRHYFFSCRLCAVNYKTDFINLKICWVTLSEVLIIRIGLGCLYLNRCCGISSFESDALDCIYAMQYNPDFQEDRNPGVPISMFYMSCIFA